MRSTFICSRDIHVALLCFGHPIVLQSPQTASNSRKRKMGCAIMTRIVSTLFLCTFTSLALLTGCASKAQVKPAPTPTPVATKPATVTPAPTPVATTPPRIKRVPPPNAGEMEEAASKRSPVIGSKATPFALQNPADETVKLADFAGKWTVVYFYPADDTPGCTCQATEFTDLLARFHNLNAVVVGISPDPPVMHAVFMNKYNLKLTLLSDTKHETMKAYGAFVETKIGDKKVDRVLRSTFLIDPNGVIAWHWPEVIPEGHAERVRDRLAQLVAAKEKATSKR